MYGSPGINYTYTALAGVQSAMESSVCRTEPQPSTLPDPRRCLGRSYFFGCLDPVVMKAARSGSNPTMTSAGNVTTVAKRGAASRLGNASSLGSDSMIVTRRYNTVLEDMQAKWAKEQTESLSQTPGEHPRKCSNSPGGGQVSKSVQESLARLVVQVQQLCTVVTDLKARSDLQIEVHTVRLPTVSTPVSRMRGEEYDDMLTILSRC